MYEWLDFGDVISHEYDIIWNSKISFNIRIFMWLVRKKKILTKNNLVQRGWMGDTSCVYCSAYENIDHLFVTCPVANMLWDWIFSHNGFTFQGVHVDDLWIIYFCIPLKDKILIELVRSVVCWTLWIERNDIIFQSKTPSQMSDP
jgi:zinc-binding in reverse transcriptase